MKTGWVAAATVAAGSAEVAHVVAELLAGVVPLVVDPVLVAPSGAVLGDRALVAALAERGADLDATDRWGDSALREALNRGHAACAELLRSLCPGGRAEAGATSLSGIA